jgi:hypothetical protein
MIEFTFSNCNWFAFKRNIKKFLGQYDEYSLVEDINDFDYTNFVNIKPFSYSAGLSFSSILQNGYDILQTKIEDFHFNSETFSEAATAYISFSFSNVNGNFYYNSNYGLEETTDYDTYDLYVVKDDDTPDLSTFTVSIPTDETGNLVDGKYYLGVHLISNYEASNDSIVATYSRYYNYEFKSEKGNIILIGGNNQSIICYDINNILSPISNNFVFATFTQSKIGDIRSIERKMNTPDVYISGDLNVAGSAYADIISALTKVQAGTQVTAGPLGFVSELGGLAIGFPVATPLSAMVAVDVTAGVSVKAPLVHGVMVKDVLGSMMTMRGQYNSHIHKAPKGPTSTPLRKML